MAHDAACDGSWLYGVVRLSPDIAHLSDDELKARLKIEIEGMTDDLISRIPQWRDEVRA